MALVDLTKIFQVPGRLVANPTSFAGSFPYGGTALGAARAITLVPGVKHKEVPIDPLGVQAAEVVYLGSSFRLVTTCRGFDPDAVSTVFPNVSTPANGVTSPAQRTIQDGTGVTTKAGTLRSAAAVELAFVAEDALEHPSVLLYRAIPVLDPSTAIVHAMGEFWEFTVGWIAIPRASDGKSASIGLLEFLTP